MINLITIFSFFYCFPSFGTTHSHQHIVLEYLNCESYIYIYMFVLETGIQLASDYALVSFNTGNQTRSIDVGMFQNPADILLCPLESKCSISQEYTCLFRISHTEIKYLNISEPL